MADVLIIVGSKSDMGYADICFQQLADLKLTADIIVSSAHRHPQETAEHAAKAADKGYQVIIAMAGLSAALPGTVAAHTLLPVIGVPLPAALGGMDSLLSVVQMPPGIPVAAVGIGKPGAKNAAILAARIIGLYRDTIKQTIAEHRRKL